MKLVVFVSIVVVASVSAFTQLDDWKQYKANHGKSYSSLDEEKLRLQNFLASKDFVERHNARYDDGEVTFKVALNKFADMTNEEFRSKYTGLGKLEKKLATMEAATQTTLENKDIPESFDWRDKGAVTPVKNQGECASGWAFSVSGAVEAAHQIVTGDLVELSTQQVVDCAGLWNCMAALTFGGFNYIIYNGGINTEDSYPYTGAVECCRTTGGVIGASISAYAELLEGDEDSLTKGIATIGPISATIDASHDSFRLYSSGVYNELNCSSSSSDTKHGVLAVGYDSQNGTDYYIVKNSFGLDWGQSGYIFMSRNKDNQCGIATSPYFPNV